MAKKISKPTTWKLEAMSSAELISIAEARLQKHHTRSRLRFWLWMRLRGDIKTLKYTRSKMFADWYATEALDIVLRRMEKM